VNRYVSRTVLTNIVAAKLPKATPWTIENNGSFNPLTGMSMLLSPETAADDVDTLSKCSCVSSRELKSLVLKAGCIVVAAKPNGSVVLASKRMALAFHCTSVVNIFVHFISTDI
jgi:hypothetical protein